MVGVGVCRCLLCGDSCVVLRCCWLSFCLFLVRRVLFVVVDCRMLNLVSGFGILCVGSCLLFVVECVLFFCSWFSTCCLLFVVCNGLSCFWFVLLFVVYCVLLISCRMMVCGCFVSFAFVVMCCLFCVDLVFVACC